MTRDATYSLSRNRHHNNTLFLVNNSTGNGNLLRTVGNIVREKRLAKGWSQEELSFNCGLHRTYVGAVERGERNLTLLSLQKIADALGLPLTALFTEQQEGIDGNQTFPRSR